MRIVLLGAGNLGSHLARAIDQASGLDLIQIYSRSQTSAEALATALLHIPTPISSPDQVCPDADAYIYCVPDGALTSLWEAMPPTLGCWLHTAGSVSLAEMAQYHPDSGVLYPLQTFSREREIAFGQVPLYIEGATAQAQALVDQLARSLSSDIHWATTEQRLILHLSAVLSCNLSNHLIALAESLLEQYGLPPKTILPLLREMIGKIGKMPAREAQTGPAVRGDQRTLLLHERLLSDREELQTIYRLISQSIQAMKLSDTQNTISN